MTELVKCTDCRHEFQTEDGMDQHGDYLGSVMCPECHSIVDMDSESFYEHCSPELDFSKNPEYLQFCEWSGLIP